MWHTFEMRWFFAEPPLDIAQHFDASAAAPHRTDWYAVPCDPRCGIKLREGRLETKLRVGMHGVRTFREISGHLESWQKWALAFGPGDCPAEQTLAESGWLAVQKRRFLRHFEVTPDRVIETEQRPTNGCEFELTELTDSAAALVDRGLRGRRPGRSPANQSGSRRRIRPSERWPAIAVRPRMFLRLRPLARPARRDTRSPVNRAPQGPS